MDKKLLAEKLWDAKNNASVTGCNNKDGDNKELPFFKNDVSNATYLRTSVEAVTRECSQAGIPLDLSYYERKLMI
jgi:hypothetical protein